MRGSEAGEVTASSSNQRTVFRSRDQLPTNHRLASRHGQLSHDVLPHLTVGLGVQVTSSLDCREAGNVVFTMMIMMMRSMMTLTSWRQVVRGIVG